MSTSGLVTMIVGVGVVWGALAASIVHAVRVHRANGRSDTRRPDL